MEDQNKVTAIFTSLPSFLYYQHLYFLCSKGSYLDLVMVSVWEVTHHSLDCSVGLSFCAMWYKALIAFMLNKGGFLSAGREGKQSVFCFRYKKPLDGVSYLPNSIQVIPKDQTSTFPSYWPSSIARMTSGAILDDERGVANQEEKTFNSCEIFYFHFFSSKTQNHHTQ